MQSKLKNGKNKQDNLNKTKLEKSPKKNEPVFLFAKPISPMNDKRVPETTQAQDNTIEDAPLPDELSKEAPNKEELHKKIDVTKQDTTPTGIDFSQSDMTMFKFASPVSSLGPEKGNFEASDSFHGWDYCGSLSNKQKHQSQFSFTAAESLLPLEPCKSSDDNGNQCTQKREQKRPVHGFYSSPLVLTCL